MSNMESLVEAVKAGEEEDAVTYVKAVIEEGHEVVNIVASLTDGMRMLLIYGYQLKLGGVEQDSGRSKLRSAVWRGYMY